MPAWRAKIAATVGLLVFASAPRDGTAYEFEANAQSVGQGNSLRTLRLRSANEHLLRRRISQSLRLHIWDLASHGDGVSRFDPQPVKGPKLYFSSYLRLDQEFGSYGTGQLLLNGEFRDAIDVIPELEQGSLQFDLLYGYFGAEGLYGGRLDLFIGRQMEVETLDWFNMDGLKARLHLPAGIVAEAFGGLRVRDASWLGSEALEPDGTSGALCEEYVEGGLPGSGSWRPIDGLPTMRRSPLTSDDSFCPQRHELMPTFGGAIATEGLPSLQARLSYRRSQSTRPGIIDDVGRLDNPDLGYYPNEGQAPGKWGVNEERLALTLRSQQKLGRNIRLVPFVGVRYSLLHGLVDEAHAGVQAGRGAHRVEAEAFYSVPTFDGDSIFNVFSTEPYSDVRTSYYYGTRRSSWNAYGRAWGRRYHSEDSEQAPMSSPANEYAGGLQSGASYRVARDKQVRLDAFGEDGFGGVRAGGFLATRWRLRPDTLLTSRLSVVHFDDNLRSDLHGTNFGAQLGTTYLIQEDFAASLILEENTSRLDSFQLGVFAVIDLAFTPDM